MREEVESIVCQEGWTKTAIGQMRRVDSFIRETQRLNMLSICMTSPLGYFVCYAHFHGPVVGMSRKARNSFTFLDGTVIPPNAFVSVAADYMHRSENNYSDPNKFDGFRFSDMLDEEGEGPKHQIVTLGINHLPFGNGRHAWCVCSLPNKLTCCLYVSFFLSPGRFFAATELKAMLAHVLVSYDVKFENEGVSPASVRFGPSSFPSRSAKVMFRKR
jgi:hypothetical protein